MRKCRVSSNNRFALTDALHQQNKYPSFDNFASSSASIAIYSYSINDQLGVFKHHLHVTYLLKSKARFILRTWRCLCLDRLVISTIITTLNSPLAAQLSKVFFLKTLFSKDFSQYSNVIRHSHATISVFPNAIQLWTTNARCSRSAIMAFNVYCSSLVSLSHLPWGPDALLCLCQEPPIN